MPENDVILKSLFEGSIHESNIDESGEINTSPDSFYDFTVLGDNGNYICMVYKFNQEKHESDPARIVSLIAMVRIKIAQEFKSEINNMDVLGFDTCPPTSEDYNRNANGYEIVYTVDSNVEDEDDNGIDVQDVKLINQ